MSQENRLKEIEKSKKLQGVTWSSLANLLPISGEALRIAFKRKSVQTEYLDVLENELKIKQQNQQSQDYSRPKDENIDVKDPMELFPTKAGSVYEELPDGSYLVSVPFVPVPAQASYASEQIDQDYFKRFQKTHFKVDRVGRGNYLGWQIMNDSMDDGTDDGIKDGDIKLARELGKQHWKSKFRYHSFPFWIIVTNNDVICKEIIDHDVEKGIITCHSLNSAYEDFKLDLREVRQIFNIIPTLDD